MEKTRTLYIYSQSKSELSRQKRIAPLLLNDGAATVFGTGVELVSRIGCSIKGVLGSCTQFFESDKENIQNSIQGIRDIQDGFQQLTTLSDKMFS